jgi:hypothetical protein
LIRRPFLLLALLLLLTACTPKATPTPEANLTVQYSFSVTSWLEPLYNCAGGTVVDARLRSAQFQDFDAVQLDLRLGQPDGLPYPAYQIGSEELLVVVNTQNPVGSLSAAQVAGLFTGQTASWKDLNGMAGQVQPWVFPASEDVEQLFERTVLGGAPVSSGARLANTPDELAQAVAADVNAVGILPGHWKAGNVAEVYTVGSFPVLAVLPQPPTGDLAAILVCLQKK